MDIKPLYYGSEVDVVLKKAGELEIGELSVEAIKGILSRSELIQKALSILPVKERINCIREIGFRWNEKLENGRLQSLKHQISTGYSKRLIDLEFNLVSYMLSEDNVRRNLESSFIKSVDGLQGFIETQKGEYYRYMPAGPVFIISSGNSLIPPLIPTTLSMVTGNLTILKPSLSNYLGVVEVYRILEEIAESNDAAKKLLSSLMISCFTYDSDGLNYLLTKAPVGVINFWGAEPARSNVTKMVAENPNHPRLLVNGPLTGFAVIDAESVKEACGGLALNMILYDQQLCSSPTQAVFIGKMEEAVVFAKKLGSLLDAVGKDFNVKTSASVFYILQSARRALRFKGADVIASSNPDNPWTVVLSKNKSTLEEVVKQIPEFNIYVRKRFIKIIVVPDLEEVAGHIKNLSHRLAFKGVDKVQSVGLSLSVENREKIVSRIAEAGVYRILNLQDMYMRSPLEPYDGVNIAAIFTYILYYREVNYPFEVFK